jgi:hypothetical protein
MDFAGERISGFTSADVFFTASPVLRHTVNTP